MGLPIWRDPDDKKTSRPAVKSDPTAHLRSAIRRRPEVHGRQTTRTPLPRDPTFPPRYVQPLRHPPPAVGFPGLREQRRGDDRRVPPISNLLEAADRRNASLPPPPPPVPESRRHVGVIDLGDEDYNGGDAHRRYHNDVPGAETREAQLNRNLTALRAQRARLDREREQIIHEAQLAADYNTAAERNHTRRISPTPPANQDEPVHTVFLDLGQPLRILRSPEPISRSQRSRSQELDPAQRNTSLAPPPDTSEQDNALLPTGAPTREMPEPSRPRLPTFARRTNRRSHPLSNAWRPESPINGLGDRNRSPTPGDGWEIMRTTIAPDETLPSLESSFVSAAASQSFNTASTSTAITEPEASSSHHSRRNSSDEEDQSSSVSSVDPDDLACAEDDMTSDEAFADDMYYNEMESPEGRERIAHQQSVRDREGNRFAMEREAARVDIGFRLIEEALESHEGRERLMRIRQNAPENVEHFEDLLSAGRRVRDRRMRRVQDRQDSPRSPQPETYGDSSRDSPGSPQPERYGEETRAAVRQASSQVHDYFRRSGADASEPRSATATSPPPGYQAHSHSNIEVSTSRDGPEPHPVSPPSRGSEREASEALLSGDFQDLDSMRRVVERLAARDDVPEEWWMSMGLNLSRTRPRGSRERNISPARDPRLQRGAMAVAADAARVRAGRIERGNARL